MGTRSAIRKSYIENDECSVDAARELLYMEKRVIDRLVFNRDGSQEGVVREGAS